jgi:hypothetical protein
MSFSIEITPRKNPNAAIVHEVIVTIDGHETVLAFQSKDDAESFARAEQARLAEAEKKASQRVREIAYRLWQEEGCPQGEDLRHWFRRRPFWRRSRPSTNEGE